MTKEKYCIKKRWRIKTIGVYFIVVALLMLFVIWCNDYSTNSQSYKESEKVIDAAIAMMMDYNEPFIGAMNMSSGTYIYVSESSPHRMIPMIKDTNSLTSEDFEKATSIYLELAKLTTLKPIVKLKNLESISFIYPLGHNIRFKPLEKLKKLKYLSITAAKMIGGSGTYYITVPKKMNLYEKLRSKFKKSKSSKYNFEPEPFDLKQLRNLRNLEELFIGTEYAENIKALSKLTKLQSLRIYFTNITDMNSFVNLTGLKNLKNLEINDYFKNDTIHFDNFVNLEHLNLEVSEITDINSVANLTKLKTLNLAHTEVNNIDSLAKLENLEELNLLLTKITDITPLQNLTKLKKLNLSSMKITDISLLKNFVNLEQLEMFNTQISDLKPLENLVNLRKLNINSTLVEDLEPLSKLTNLQELIIYGYHETKVSQDEIDKLQKALPQLNIH